MHNFKEQLGEKFCLVQNIVTIFDNHQNYQFYVVKIVEVYKKMKLF